MNCQNCSSNYTNTFIKEDILTLVKCNDCGLITKPDVHFLYENLGKNYYNQLNFDRSKEAKEIVNVINKHIQNSGHLNLIEIGCGTGSLLAALREHKINVFGFEPSAIACQIAAARYNLHTIKNEYFLKNTFGVVPDVILLYDVIEHLEDPLPIFQNIKKNMDQHTIIVIKSGDPYSFNAQLYPARWHYYRSDQHVKFYSKSSLDILASNAGMQQIKYYRCRHAYGGIAFKILLKNIIKALLFRLVKKYSLSDKDRAIALANDHFISIFKLK